MLSALPRGGPENMLPRLGIARGDGLVFMQQIGQRDF